MGALVVAVWLALGVGQPAKAADPAGSGLAASGPATSVAVLGVRIGDHGDKTRLVLDLSEQVKYSIFTLADPYRIIVDLPEVDWRVTGTPLNAPKGVLANLRYGLFSKGTSRLVLDARGPVSVKKSFIIPPVGDQNWRLVLDLEPTSREAFDKNRVAQDLARAANAPAVQPKTATAAPDKPSSAQTTSQSQPRQQSKSRKKIIALDAGHGGVDPGTIGYSGTYEKNITLAMARELKQQLESTGRYKIVLTRDRDIFLRLRSRVARARDAGASLFISIHADATPNRTTRGASVYTLSERASDKEAAALAEKENKSDLIAGIDLTGESTEVTNILIDLAQRESMNQSALVAAGLVRELGREIRLLRNTHRFAGFAVLKAPDMASVLLEVGFLSNPKDEKALLNKRYRAKLASAMVRGIDRYYDNVEEASLP